MSYIQQFFTSRDNNANAQTFVGQEGRLWWDPVTNQIYSSNGSTPGGVPLSGGGSNVTPGGSNSQVQFNDLNAFGGSANLTFDSGNGTLTASILSATGNVSGNYFIGNGSLLTGISVSSNRIFNGTSNVEIAAANGNITISAAAGNTWTFDTSGALTLPGATAGENIATQSGYITVGNLLIGQGGALFNSNNDSWALYGNLSDSGTTILIPSDADAGNGLALYFENQISNVEIRSGGTWTFDTAGNLTLPGNLTTTANITGGNLITAGAISAASVSASGNLSGTSIVGTLTTAVQTNITSVGTLGSLSVTGNITGGNLITSAALSAASVSASSNITGGNLITSAALSAASVSASGNITGGNVIVGNLVFSTDTISSQDGTITIDPAAVGVTGLVIIQGNLQVNGNTTTINSNVVSTNDLTYNLANNAINSAAANGGGIEVGPIGSPYITWLYNSTADVFTSSGGVSAVGNITGSYFLGNGSQLTGIDATSIQNGTSNVKVVSSGGNATVSIGGTSNVVVWATTGEYVTGLISATGNITGGNLNAAGLSLSSNVVSALNVTANIAGGNITTPGIISSTGNITSSGNISGGNILGGANVNATLFTGTTVSVTGNITGGNVNISGNIVDTGALSIITGSNGNIALAPNGTGIVTASGAFSAVGNITGGNLSVGTGTLSGGNIVNTNANGVGNIGSASVYYNTVFAKATSAQYADLAEYYVADADYAPGTVLIFGGDKEVTVANSPGDTRIAGVVSTNPAYNMNSGLKAPHVAAVALAGRIPTKVTGLVSKGDMMIAAGNGHAHACASPVVGTVIGKALENFDGESGVIEIVVGVR